MIYNPIFLIYLGRLWRPAILNQIAIRFPRSCRYRNPASPPGTLFQVFFMVHRLKLLYGD